MKCNEPLTPALSRTIILSRLYFSLALFPSYCSTVLPGLYETVRQGTSQCCAGRALSHILACREKRTHLRKVVLIHIFHLPPANVVLGVKHASSRGSLHVRHFRHNLLVILHQSNQQYRHHQGIGYKITSSLTTGTVFLFRFLTIFIYRIVPKNRTVRSQN